MTDPAAPVLAQLLPSGISPEGAMAIPERKPAGPRPMNSNGGEDGARPRMS